MTEAELPQLTAQVLWAAFALAAAFGAVAQRTHFCTMGAIADVVNFGDWTRMRMWLLAIGVATTGFAALVALGLVDAADSVYTGPRFIWLSNVVGGVLFGFGMVLASGCGSKTLIRVGNGSLKSLLVMVVLAVSAYATLRGVVAVGRVATIDTVDVALPAGQDLPSLLEAAVGVDRATLAPMLGALLGLGLIGFAVARPEGRQGDTVLGGVGVGLAVVGVWWVSGVLGHVAEHPQTLEETFLATNSRQMESLTFVAPIAYTMDWLILFSDASKLLTIGIVTTIGVICGSAAVALASRTFRWEGFAGTEDTANHVVGGVLMGVGGVTAMGCTIGQGITGVSTLALGSFVALAGIVLGAVLALRWQTWRLDRQV